MTPQRKNPYNATRENFFDSKCVLKRVFEDFRKTREELRSKNTSVKKLSKKTIKGGLNHPPPPPPSVDRVNHRGVA